MRSLTLIVALLSVMASLAAGEPQHGSMGVLRALPLKTRAVALTIDLGCSAKAGSIEGMLDSLDKREVQATWFVTGWMVRNHPGLLKRIVARGDTLANHTDTHPHCTRVSEARVQRELRGVEELLASERLAIARPAYFRPPFGEYDRRVVHAAAELGYRTVHWSATTDDYNLRRDPTAAARGLLNRVTPGGIILMHATNVSRWMLPTLLDDLAGRGYEIVSLHQLLKIAHSENP